MAHRSGTVLRGGRDARADALRVRVREQRWLAVHVRALAPRRIQQCARVETERGTQRVFEQRGKQCGRGVVGGGREQCARVYDDGDATYLLWGAKQEVPAILVLNEKGEEGPVNYAVRGPAIVLDIVPQKIVLRIGKKSATLENLRNLQQPAAAPAATAEVMPAAAVAASQAPETQGQPQ